MTQLNRVIIVGRLTADPEPRQSKSGKTQATFSIALNRKNLSGEDHASFIDVKAFEKTADFLAAHFTKGKEVLVEGRLEQERWQDRDTGANRSRLVVIADRLGFVGYDPAGRPGDGDDAPRGDRRPAPRGDRPAPAPRNFPGDKPDDLPF